MTDITDVVARTLFEGNRPADGPLVDASWDKMSELRKEFPWRCEARHLLPVLREMLGNALNAHLIEMKPDMDDSITGFNEAWDVMREVLK